MTTIMRTVSSKDVIARYMNLTRANWKVQLGLIDNENINFMSTGKNPKLVNISKWTIYNYTGNG